MQLFLKRSVLQAKSITIIHIYDQLMKDETKNTLKCIKTEVC